MFRRLTAAAVALLCLAGCATTPPPYVPPPSLTYIHVWGGQPPEPYYSAALRLRDANTVRVVRTPLQLAEQVCGANRSSDGWVATACTAYGNATGTPFIVIASEVTDPVALENLLIHELGHVAGWPGDHEGGLKPLNHLDRCIAGMTAEGLTLSKMRSLCLLDSGAPLRTQAERDRWAGMR